MLILYGYCSSGTSVHALQAGCASAGIDCGSYAYRNRSLRADITADPAACTFLPIHYGYHILIRFYLWSLNSFFDQLQPLRDKLNLLS